VNDDGGKMVKEDQPMRRMSAGQLWAGLGKACIVWGMLALSPLVLAGCGPVSLQAAERQCFERARLASRPRGEILAGATSKGGSYGRVEVELSSDFLLGKDPSAVYESCVMAKAGQAPSRPLYARPDWRG
jgi:hypothetical protein